MDTLVEKILVVKENLLKLLSLQEVYKEIVEEAVVFFDGIYGSLTLYQNGTFQRVYSTMPFAFLTTNRKKGNVYKAFTEKKIQIASIGEMEKSHPELHEMGVKTSVFVPVMDKGVVLGVLTINFKEEKISTPLTHFSLFAAIAASAIRRVQYYEETREALMIRDNFLQIISHEVRTPLTTITGYLQLIKKKLQRGEDVRLSWIDQGIEESEKIIRKVKDLVDANDIQSGNALPFLFEQVNLTTILHSSLASLQVKYPSRNIMTTGTMPKEMWIVGDVIKLEYVFHNLLENSVKFSPQETTTTVQVEEKKEDYRITIVDHGHGMSRSEMERVFQGFYKSMKDMKTGLGIGLYLSQHILQEHRGGLKIVSRLHTGTTVTIKLPKSNL